MANRAKTSARSKGYRRTVQKKPFLSKKEILWLVAIVAAIALAIVLFNVFYDDGSLKVQNGVPVVENAENSLLINAKTADNPKYYKVAEVGQIDGYARKTLEDSSGVNLDSFEFTPVGESPLTSISVYGASGGAPAKLAATAHTTWSSYADTLSDVKQIEVGGRDVHYLIYSYATTAEDTGVTTAVKTLSAYLPAASGDYSVVVRESVTAESEPNLDAEGIAAFAKSVDVPEEELLASLETALPAISIDASK